SCARRYLNQACDTGETVKIAGALQEVFARPAPLGNLASEVTRCLTLLSSLQASELLQVGRQVLSSFSVKNEALVFALESSAQQADAHELLALITEYRLIACP